MKAKVGFVGSAVYEIGNDDDEHSKLTDALLTFAHFSNIGGGRTAGMGVVKTRAGQGEVVKSQSTATH